MKITTPTLLYLLVFCGTAIAQTEPPPAPPPPIKEMRLDRITKIDPISYTFESKEEGFKVIFPAKPQVSSKPVESSFGKTDIRMVTLDASFASYYVSTIEFPTDLNDRYDLNIRFDLVRNGQVKQMSGRIVKDTELFLGNYYGRDIVLENDVSTRTIRMLAAGPRIFLVGVITPGQHSTQSEKLKSRVDKLIGDFLDSFQIITVAKASQLAVELPNDFGVTVSPGKFQSAFLGISMSVPDWTVVSTEDVDMLAELGKEKIRKTDAPLAEHITDKTARYLVMLSKLPPGQKVSDAFLSVVAERAPYPTFTAKAVADTFSKVYKSPDEQVTSPPTPIRLGNLEFYWVETFNAKLLVNQRLFFANVKGIAFEILMIYKDKADLQTMMNAVSTLKLEAGK